jgi:hypothetical protein
MLLDIIGYKVQTAPAAPVELTTANAFKDSRTTAEYRAAWNGWLRHQAGECEQPCQHALTLDCIDRL